MSGDINFGGDNKIYWGRNTDSASISFKNDGDGDDDSYMSFVTSDNGNEYFRWSHSSGSTNTEWMALRSDGLRVGGTKVSLEGHSHNDLYYTKTEVNNKLNDKSDSGHNHDDRYVKKTGDTMFGALNFANGTWNLVGDDSYMGDCNISGHVGIKAANTTYPGISFFNNANAHLGNLTAYSSNIKYGAYSLQFLDNGNTNVSAGTWMNPFSTYNASAVADGQAICVWGQSSQLSNLATDTGDMSLWLKRVNSNVATLNMVLDGEYYANGNQRLAHVSEIPNSLKNPYALTISLNGTSQGPYDGSAAKNINITPSSIGAATSDHNHDGRYVRYYAVTTLDCNNLAVGLTAAGVSATNAAHTNHSAFLYISDVGTPFQIQIPDSSVPYIYKRYYSSGEWSGWFKLNAGYADSAGSASNLTVHQYLSNTDTTWWPLIWGGSSHNNTSDSTGEVYKSYDKLSWQTSSQTLYATNLYTGRLETINNHYYHFNSDATLRIYGSPGDNTERIYFQAGIDNRIDDYDIPSYGGEQRHSIILNPRGGFVGIGDENPISKLTVAGSITPTAANVYNIGTSKNYYNTIYSRVLCAETTSTSIYHQIAIGYPGHDRIDFDEWGGAFYFNKTSSSSRHTIATITLGGLYTTNTITYGLNGLQYFNQSTGTTSGANNANPYNDWFHIIRMNHNNANGYFVDLATAFHQDAMYFRRIVSGQDNGWRKILHDGNSYVTGGKGVINGTTITQVDNAINADTVDGEHASAFTRIIGRNSIITTGTAPYNYIHLFRIANSNSYSTLDCEIDFRTRYHSAKIEIRIATNKPQYGVGNSSISIVKKVINGRSCNFWVLQTVQSSNYNYYDVYYESGAWNGGSYGIIFKGSNGVLVFEHKGINLESLPDKVIPVSNNVATSATKLQTPRKIWGQSFDGTGDVSGSLSNTGTITASTAATYDIGSNALDYRYGYFQWIGAKSNTNLRLAANNSDNQIVLHTNGNVGVGTNGPTEKLTVNGWIGTNGIYTNRTGSSTDGGVSLYSNVDPMTYGIAFRGTGTYGTHGYVTSASDWATYLTMNDSTTRGWIFRRGDTNVASIAGSGNMAIGQHLEFSNGAHISTNRSTDYHYGYTFNLGDNTKSIGMYSGPVEEAGGVVISPDGCLIYNSSDCGYNLQVRDKDLGSDLTNIATLTFGIEQSGYYAWSRGGFKKNGSSDSYVLLGGGGHSKITDLSVANADTVDGYHANGLLTALSNSDNGISITVGGTTKSVSNISVNYANNADTLDGYHENSFLRYRGATGTDQEATLWDQIGIKQYNNALPDNLTDVYNYGSVISLPGYSSRFEIYASHLSSSGNGLYYRSGWGSDKRSWLKFIDSSNIGSQSVKYASSAGNADTVDGYHANSFLIDRGGDYKGLLYDLPCKSIFSGYNPSDAPTTGWVSGIVLGSNWNSSHFQHYLVEIGSRWYTTRIYSNSKMTNWNTFAYLTDNVASATKLATARTIWGQSFDGTGDIPINVAAKMPYVLFKRFDNNENAGYVGCGSSSNNNIYISSYTNANIILDGNNIGIGTYSPTYKLDVNGQVRASGFRHSSVNSDNYVLLAGGGYSQGVPVRYWAIYQMQIGNSSSWCRYFKDSGNYDFITAVTWKETGVAVVQLKFPPGYSINNTLIFGNGENKYSGNWKLPVYVSISITNFSYNDEIGVKIADNDTPSTGDARIYFMCMG